MIEALEIGITSKNIWTKIINKGYGHLMQHHGRLLKAKWILNVKQPYKERSHS